MKTLLGPKFESQNPVEFYDRIVSLYQPRTKSGKSVELQIKGRIAITVTSKRTGVFELRFQTAMGLKETKFEFSKTKELSESLIPILAKSLMSSEAKVREFLEKRKFTFSG